VFARQLNGETVIIGINRHGSPKLVTLPLGALDVRDGVTFRGGGERGMVVNGQLKVFLYPQNVMAFTVIKDE
ncbi:MAG TPA: hypothetical protein VJ751_09000, partial [Pyrinomonadaceae bacterium]|nr:hypothetical protein [Pyrinomonadaceae bacterium]